jgi:hypothetical protein
MRNRLLLPFLVLFCCMSSAADVWPKRFIWTKGIEYTLVLLYEDGRAAYSTRQVRGDSTQYFFTASRANWSLCEGSKVADSPQCISVHVEGYSDLGDASFRFDYLLKDDALTEFDKMGVQATLKHYCDRGEGGCASNKSLERTRDR